MIDQATLLTYLAILLGFVFIPGPAVLLTLAHAMASGTRVGVATGLGIAVGDIFHTLMAVVGLSAVILASAFLFDIIKYAGAAYLVYLGIRAFREPVPEITDGEVQPASPGSFWRAFREGMAIEAMNPKSALFFLAFLPQFVNPANGAVGLQLLILGLLFVAFGLFATVVVAFAAGRVGRFLRRNPTIMKWQNRAVGGIYCALGLRLALQER